MAEVAQHVCIQVPPALARRLDAKVDAERAGAPMGNVNRSSVIRAALTAFLDGVADPKDAPPERTKRRRVDTDAKPASRGHTRRPAPAPEIRTRTRRALPVDA